MQILNKLFLLGLIFNLNISNAAEDIISNAPGGPNADSVKKNIITKINNDILQYLSAAELKEIHNGILNKKMKQIGLEKTKAQKHLKCVNDEVEINKKSHLEYHPSHLLPKDGNWAKHYGRDKEIDYYNKIISECINSLKYLESLKLN